MRRILIAAAAIIAAYSLSPTNAHAQALAPPVPPPVHNIFWPNEWIPWVAFGCPASIILSGIVADFKDNRQLTYWEAWTCGLLYWIPLPPQPPKKGKHPHHTSALIVDRPRYG